MLLAVLITRPIRCIRASKLFYRSPQSEGWWQCSQQECLRTLIIALLWNDQCPKAFLLGCFFNAIYAWQNGGFGYAEGKKTHIWFYPGTSAPLTTGGIPNISRRTYHISRYFIKINFPYYTHLWRKAGLIWLAKAQPGLSAENHGRSSPATNSKEAGEKRLQT